MTALLKIVPSWQFTNEPTDSNLRHILKKLRCPTKRVMAETEYVVKILDIKINRICTLTRTAAELTSALSLNVAIKTRIWPTETAIIRMKVYTKYFLQRTGFSYSPFLRNEPYGDIPHSCEAKCITFRVLRISAIARKTSDAPERIPKLNETFDRQQLTV